MLLIGGALVIFALAGYALFSPPTSVKDAPKPSVIPVASQQPAQAEKKAAFAIFTNGQFRIFTAPMYHRLSPDVYIESSNPNIIHVQKTGVTWDDFFKTLPFSLTKECLTTGTGQTFCTGGNQQLRFYLNGEEKPDALDQVVGDGDKLLITVGSESDVQIRDQLQQIPNTQ